MTRILVRSPGLQTTVQDLGRFGLQALGIPPAGALDADALETANLLLGNPRGAACLECTLSGPELEFSGSAAFAICGAPMEAALNGTSVPLYETLFARTGDVLSLGAAETGLRAYIAFAGGVDVEPVMGSRSTYARGGFGGWQGRALKAGDTLPLTDLEEGSGSDRALRFVPEELRPAYPSEITVRALRSHEADRFEASSLSSFFSQPYAVSPKSDRMGCRLEGEPLTHVRGADIISGGVQTGTVQVPGDGKPIVLLADRQTTGGYTRIAHVIQADLPKLGQARPGDTVRFLETTLEAAREALKARETEITGRVRERKPIPAIAGISPSAPGRTFRITVDGRIFDVEVREV